jgi:hypothetical protein
MDIADTELPDRESLQSLTLRALTDLGGRATRTAIMEQAHAIGKFTPEQLAVPPPPSHQNYASKVDYLLSWSLTENKSNGLMENPQRGIWMLATSEGRKPTP